MFLESLVESCRQREPRRGWATLLSFSLQTICVGALVMLPLIYTGALPPLTFSKPIVLPPPATSPHPRAQAQRSVDLVKPPSELTDTGGVHAPREIPNHIWMPKTREAAPPPLEAIGDGIGVIGSNGPAVASNRVISELLRDVPNVPIVATPKARMAVSEGVQDALLIRRIMPAYPPLARQTGIQGAVVLHAVISKDGSIESVHVLSGHPLLIPAALHAVRQWRYRPTYLNRQPIEVETQITINFVLGRG